MLHCRALPSLVAYCRALRCIALHCMVVDYASLYCIVWKCIVLCSVMLLCYVMVCCDVVCYVVSSAMPCYAVLCRIALHYDVFMCVYIYIYAFIHTYIYTHMGLHMCLCVCVHVCIVVYSMLHTYIPMYVYPHTHKQITILPYSHSSASTDAVIWCNFFFPGETDLSSAWYWNSTEALGSSAGNLPVVAVGALPSDDVLAQDYGMRLGVCCWELQDLGWKLPLSPR